MKKALTLLLAAALGISTLAFAACGSDGRDGADGKDGINGINGTDGVNGKDGKDGEKGEDGVNGKSAYELYIENNPSYTGDEQQWLDDLASGKLKNKLHYNMVSYGRNCAGEVVTGTAVTEGALLKLGDCVIKFDEPVVMPVTENSEWEIHIGGTLAKNDASTEILTSSEATPEGRIYFGVFAGNNIAYMGANIGGVYFNYCWDLPGAIAKGEHEYTVRFKDGVYGLSVDGGNFAVFTSVNGNQSNSVALDTGSNSAVRASLDLTEKIRAISGQEYFKLTSIGANSHKCNSTLSYIDADTSSLYGFEDISHHPLYGKNIYHLGSSISYGYANGGVSFAEQIASLTGSRYVKQTVSGTTLATVYDNSYVARWRNFTFDDNPDFLVLQLSTNDFTRGGVSAGSVTAAFVKEGFDTATVAGAIEEIIAGTKAVSPDTQIVIYTCAVKPSWGARTAYAGFINTALKQIEAKWGVLTVDLYNKDTVYNASWMSDDIHPNGEGYANLFTPAMINAMTDYLLKK